MSYMYCSKPEILRFQPKPPFMFPLQQNISEDCRNISAQNVLRQYRSAVCFPSGGRPATTISRPSHILLISRPSPILLFFRSKHLEILVLPNDRDA